MKIHLLATFSATLIFSVFACSTGPESSSGDVLDEGGDPSAAGTIVESDLDGAVEAPRDATAGDSSSTIDSEAPARDATARDAGGLPRDGAASDAGAPHADGGRGDGGATTDGDAGAPRADGGATTDGDAGTDANTRPAATWTSVFAILGEESRCERCHYSTEPSGSIGFNIKDISYANLVGKKARLQPCDKKGQVLVVPGDPNASLLYRKLANTQNCGGEMPLSSSGQLTAAELEIVASWIAGGAKND
jgi:hypothetical protein